MSSVSCWIWNFDGWLLNFFSQSLQFGQSLLLGLWGQGQNLPTGQGHWPLKRPGPVVGLLTDSIVVLLGNKVSIQIFFYMIYTLLSHFYKVFYQFVKKVFKCSEYNQNNMKLVGNTYPNLTIRFRGFVYVCLSYMSHVMRKPVLCNMQTTKMQISLHICPVWSASLLFTP